MGLFDWLFGKNSAAKSGRQQAREDRAPGKACQVGDRVLASWLDAYFYPGRIRHIESNSCEIAFDDGDKGRISIELNDGKKVSIDDDGISVDDTKGNSLTITTQSGDISIVAKGQLSPTKPATLAAQRSAAKSKRGIMPEPLAYVLEQILR